MSARRGNTLTLTRRGVIFVEAFVLSICGIALGAVSVLMYGALR